MSTRCQVGILPYIDSRLQDCKLFLYKLHEGYPDSIIERDQRGKYPE